MESNYAKQKNYISNKLYNNRNDLLKNIFDSTTYNNGLVTRNCAANVTYIIDKIVSNTFFSCTENLKCIQCGYVKEHKMTYVNINVNTEIKDIPHNISLIPHNINTDRKCYICNDTYLEKTIHFNELLFIDTQKTTNDDPTTKIDDIANIIKVGQQDYCLKSAIQYIPGSNQDNIGHYICHVKRPNSQWEEYNDFSKTIKSSPKEMKIHLLIYLKKEIKIVLKKN